MARQTMQGLKGPTTTAKLLIRLNLFIIDHGDDEARRIIEKLFGVVPDIRTLDHKQRRKLWLALDRADARKERTKPPTMGAIHREWRKSLGL